MTWVLALLLASGITVFASGIPWLRPSDVRERVLPYVDTERTLLRRARRTRWWDGLGNDDLLQQQLAILGSQRTPVQQRSRHAVAALVAAGAFGVVLVAGSGGVRAAHAVLVGSMGLFAYAASQWNLSRRVARYRDSVTAQLPDAVDLLTLCVVSGVSIAEACRRVAEHVHGAVGAEFQKIADELRSGAPLSAALLAFGDRIDTPGVAHLVDALVVALEKGAPVADVLRAQAEDVRESQRRYLLELAGRREVLMLIPVVLLILPVTVLFVLYPGLVSLDLLVP